jgi:hypothetical protein
MARSCNLYISSVNPDHRLQRRTADPELLVSLDMRRCSCRWICDEVIWKKQHNYLTLVADHQRRLVVWGCEGKGEKAAEAFFEELDPDPGRSLLPAARAGRSVAPGARARDHGPVRPVPDRPPGHGIPAAWLQDDRDLDPAVVARASRLIAVSLDMTGGYAGRSPRPTGSHLH